MLKAHTSEESEIIKTREHMEVSTTSSVAISTQRKSDPAPVSVGPQLAADQQACAGLSRLLGTGLPLWSAILSSGLCGATLFWQVQLADPAMAVAWTTTYPGFAL